MLYARFLKLSDRYELIAKNLLIIPYNNSINDNDDSHHIIHNNDSNKVFIPPTDDIS